MKWLLFLHILGVSVAVGAGAAQMQLMRESGKGGRDARVMAVGARAVQVKVQQPGYLVALVTGIVMLIQNPGLLKGQGWLHAKLGLICLLLAGIYLEGRTVKRLLHTHREDDLGPGVKVARTYAGRFAILSGAIVTGIILLATARPF